MRSKSTGHFQLLSPSGELAGLLLFACSLTLQLICAGVRMLLVLPLLWLSLLGLGIAADAHALTLAAGFGPLAFSLLTLAFPYGGWLWQASAGGRSPSLSERARYEATLQELISRRPGVRAPRAWFVTDWSEFQAALYGDTLMLTCGLLSSPSLASVLAHELGHLNSTDGRLAAALHRMTTPPRGELAWPWRAISFLATGEAVVWATRLPWAHYWRAREFAADAYAARLGEGGALIEFLRTGVQPYDVPTPFPWLSARAHPATELRIERLLEINQREEGRQ